jgi:hypothetical protein
VRFRPIADVSFVGRNAIVATVVYLSPGEEMPDVADHCPWLLIHHSGDGRFFGSGASWKPSGEWVGYRSLSDDDGSLEAAIGVAQQWAALYSVPTIWVEAQ